MSAAHVPLPMLHKVDQISARLERSRNWIIKQFLHGLGNSLTLEALDGVTSEPVIDHQTVQNWADSNEIVVWNYLSPKGVDEK